MEKLVLSISETAIIPGIGISLCYRLAKSNKIPVIKLGERYVVPKNDLEQFINDREYRIKHFGNKK